MLNNISIYIHIPWCESKCPYCDFNSHAVRKDNFQEELYVKSLIDDLRSSINIIKDRKVKSIFFGGGTPSLFSSKSFALIINEIYNSLSIDENIEITMEANPSSVDIDKFSAFHDAGINRISIGIQSFQPKLLKSLGRAHSNEDAHTAVKNALSIGFKSVNIDLMYNLPNQTIMDAKDDLFWAVKYGVPHVSWYQLTIEPNTKFYVFPPKLPQESIQETIDNMGIDTLSQHYNRYEISAFSKDNHKCIHNLNYWNFGDYLGLGAGAHSKITTLSPFNVTRYVRYPLPKAYINNENKLLSIKDVSPKDIFGECMMNNLRLFSNIKYSDIEATTNISKEGIKLNLNSINLPELLNVHNDYCSTSKLGRRYLNNIIEKVI